MLKFALSGKNGIKSNYLLICFGKTCTFGLLCVSFVKVYQSAYQVCYLVCSFGFEDVMLDLTVLLSDHCFSVYFI